MQHDMGSHHPECPDRLSAINDRLIASGIDQYLAFYDAPLASIEQLTRVHPPEHVRRIMQSAPQNGIIHLDPDTAMCPATLQAALRSAGAAALAADLVMSGEVESAFCAVRPPGHHAERARAMGFCFFNNVAVAVRQALEVHGIERAAHPFYPYSGTDNPAPNMLNVPLPAGTRSDGFRQVVSDIWMPRLREFAPQAIFISAGFDAHYEDDMGSLGLVEADYVWVTEQLKQIAAESAKGRIVSILEGGYALSALARSVTAHIKALADL